MYKLVRNYNIVFKDKQPLATVLTLAIKCDIHSENTYFDKLSLGVLFPLLLKYKSTIISSLKTEMETTAQAQHKLNFM